MTVTGPVNQGTIRRLLTHKEHAIEMVELIIRVADLDLCAEEMTEDLARVHFSHTLFYFMFLFLLMIVFVSRR